MAVLGPVSTLARWRDPSMTEFDFGRGELPAGWTALRASPTTYIDAGVRRTAAPNTPVFEGGALRLEHQATQLLMQYANGTPFQVSRMAGYWSLTRTVHAGVAMYRVTPNEGDPGHYVDSGSIPVNRLAVGTRCSAQVAVKADGFNQLRVEAFSGAADRRASIAFNLITGQVLAVFNGGDSSIRLSVTAMADGVWLAKLENFDTVTGTTPMRVRVVTSGYSGDGVSSFWVGEPQFEVGPRCSSFIDVGASEVTRLPDLILAGGDWENAVGRVEGAIAAEFDATPGNNSTNMVRLANPSGGDRIDIRRQGTGGVAVTFHNDGASVAASGVGPWPARGANRVAAAYGPDGLAAYAAGQRFLNVPTAAVRPQLFNRLELAASGQVTAYISRLRLYRTRPPHEQLLAMTGV